MQDGLLLSAKQGAALLQTSDRGFHYLRKDPAFPAPVVIGKRSVRWRVADLAAYVAAMPTVRKLPEPPQLANSRKFRSGQAV